MTQVSSEQAAAVAEMIDVLGIKVGDAVKKTKGDYVFHGEVRSVFRKISGVIRYVIENDAGVCMIMNHSQLEADTSTERDALKEAVREQVPSWKTVDAETPSSGKAFLLVRREGVIFTAMATALRWIPISPSGAEMPSMMMRGDDEWRELALSEFAI